MVHYGALDNGTDELSPHRHRVTVTKRTALALAVLTFSVLAVLTGSSSHFSSQQKQSVEDTAQGVTAVVETSAGGEAVIVRDGLHYEAQVGNPPADPTTAAGQARLDRNASHWEHEVDFNAVLAQRDIAGPNGTGTTEAAGDALNGEIEQWGHTAEGQAHGLKGMSSALADASPGDDATVVQTSAADEATITRDGLHYEAQIGVPPADPTTAAGHAKLDRDASHWEHEVDFNAVVAEAAVPGPADNGTTPTPTVAEQWGHTPEGQDEGLKAMNPAPPPAADSSATATAPVVLATTTKMMSDGRNHAKNRKIADVEQQVYGTKKSRAAAKLDLGDMAADKVMEQNGGADDVVHMETAEHAAASHSYESTSSGQNAREHLAIIARAKKQREELASQHEQEQSTNENSGESAASHMLNAKKHLEAIEEAKQQREALALQHEQESKQYVPTEYDPKYKANKHRDELAKVKQEREALQANHLAEQEKNGELSSHTYSTSESGQRAAAHLEAIAEAKAAHDALEQQHLEQDAENANSTHAYVPKTYVQPKHEQTYHPKSHEQHYSAVHETVAGKSSAGLSPEARAILEKQAKHAADNAAKKVARLQQQHEHEVAAAAKERERLAAEHKAAEAALAVEHKKAAEEHSTATYVPKTYTPKGYVQPKHVQVYTADKDGGAENATHGGYKPKKYVQPKHEQKAYAEHLMVPEDDRTWDEIKAADPNADPVDAYLTRFKFLAPSKGF